MVRNFYFTLGVEHDANQRQIDAMYDAAVCELEAGGYSKVPLLAAQEAYSVVGNPPVRRAYDRSLGPQVIDEYPPERTSQAPAAEEFPQLPIACQLGPVSLTRSFRSFHPSFEELFDRLWSNFSRVTRPKAETVQSLTIEVPITRHQVITGGTAEVMVPALLKCPICRGIGGVGPFRCIHCDGRGAVADEYPVQVSFPPGHSRYTAQVSLSSLGIDNFYLTVHFRIADAAEI